MRNLKRALSLALASVMVMGLMVVGTGASYVDVSSEQNQEAIEVLQAVGVMTGDENGNFNPDANVTRNEMAVVMSNLLDYTVSSYKGTAPFSDVPSWAEPYVAACYTNGIIAGYDAKTFGGNDSVTTGQAALMLMKALGYFQYQSDFGQDWLVETTLKGSQIGLFDDVDTAATAALTRNDVAQLVLNALEANMVQYTGNGGTTIKGDGYEITTGKATYEDRTSTNSKYGKLDNERSTNNGKYIIQLGEDLYDGDLEKKDSQTDDFGRPATQWVYDGDEVGTYAKSADDSMVINKELDYAEVMVTDDDYFDYKASDISEDVEVYVNGVKATAPGSDFFKAGDVVEVFENDSDEVETIAVIRYTLAKIDSVDDDLSTSLEKQGAKYAVDLKDLDAGVFSDVDGNTYYDANDDDEKVLNGFAASTYTEGTVIAVAVGKNDAILASHVATAVEGTVSKYNSGSKAAVTVDGSSYPLTTKVKGTNPNFDFDDSTYTVYVNADGYVIGYETTASAKLEDVYYVTGVVRDTEGLYGSTSYYAQSVKLDGGTVENVKLEQGCYLSMATGHEIVAAADGKIYMQAASGTYYKQNDGTFSTTVNGTIKYKQYANLNAAASDVTSELGPANALDTTTTGLFTFTDKDGGKSANAKSNNGKLTAEVYNHIADSSYYVALGTGLGDDLKRDASSLNLSGSTASNSDFTKKAYLDDKTQYIKVEEPGDDIDVKPVTGGTSATQASTDAAAVVATKSGSNYTAAYVVLVSNAGFDAAAADADILYVDEKSSNKTASDEWELTAYFLDGSGEQTITADTAGTDNHFYTYTINDDGVYELTDVTNDSAYVPEVDGNKDYDDGTGLVTGATLTGVYNDQLSGTKTGTINFDDVDFSADVVIIDSRTKAQKNTALVTGDITSVSKLKSAIEKGSVTADVYLDDGAVILVSVTASENATGGGSTVDAKAATLSITGGDTNPVASVDIKDFGGKTTGSIAVATDAKNIKITATEPTVTGYTVSTTLKLNGASYTSGTEYTVKQADLNRGYITVEATTAFTPTNGGEAIESIVVEYTITVTGSLVAS